MTSAWFGSMRMRTCGRLFTAARTTTRARAFTAPSSDRSCRWGIRSLAQEEVDYLDASDKVKAFRDWTGQVKDAMEALPDDVYMTIDLDGFRPELMRAVGTPEPGGLTWEEALDIIDFTFANKNVLAYDVVELCPHDDDVVSSFTAARLVYKVLQYHAYHKLGLRPGQ